MTEATSGGGGGDGVAAAAPESTGGVAPTREVSVAVLPPAAECGNNELAALIVGRFAHACAGAASGVTELARGCAAQCEPRRLHPWVMSPRPQPSAVARLRPPRHRRGKAADALRWGFRRARRAAAAAPQLQRSRPNTRMRAQLREARGGRCRRWETLGVILCSTCGARHKPPSAPLSPPEGAAPASAAVAPTEGGATGGEDKASPVRGMQLPPASPSGPPPPSHDAQPASAPAAEAEPDVEQEPTPQPDNHDDDKEEGGTDDPATVAEEAVE